MGDKSKIEWTDATWNPIVGCTHVSPGCDHCYAATVHNRRYLAWKRGDWPDAPAQYHHPFKVVQLLPERLDQPLRWRRSRRIFVNSLSDLFHEDVPDEFIDQVFAVMAVAPQHTFQILTKRPARMLDWFGDAEQRVSDAGYGLPFKMAPEHFIAFGRDRVPGGWPLPNVWIGVSVEDQQRADERVPLLVQTSAAVRFLSCEPLLGPIDLYAVDWGDCRVGVDWVIAGGESGRLARPCHPEWARSLRDQCVEAGVAFFWKQWGEWFPDLLGLAAHGRPFKVVDGAMMARIGKRAAGRRLDGQTWDEFPTVAVEI